VDSEIPRVNVGSKIPITLIQSRGKFTQPPPRYNPSSLLKLMEDEGIGTKATRSEIIEILHRRGYTRGSVEPTDLGFTVVEALSRYTPAILDVETTRRMENELEAVMTEGANPEDVVSGVHGYLDAVLERFKAQEKEIGAELASADTPTTERKAKEPSRLGACPHCLKGEIKVIHNPKTGKRFAACSDRKGCGKTYPLPQRGRLTPVKSPCPKCGSPQVKVGFGAKGKQLCINPGCSGKGGVKP
jgi:DNA topoisomerase-1